MKTVRIVRRVDDLGRIVIPKEIRRQIFGKADATSEPMEIFIDGENIILRRYKTYGTSARCPKCGKQLYISDIDGYSFVCKECDENFYTMEITNCMADFWEINIPMSPQIFKENLSYLQEISNKYNCDFLGYDPTAKLLDIGWEKSFPESYILNQFIKEIEAAIK